MRLKRILFLAISFVMVGCQTPGRTVAEDAVEDYLKPQSFDMLSKYSPHKYEILFTDPLCGVYKYNKEVLTKSGKKLTQKPQNVYCKNKYDLKRSGDQANSPQKRLIEWINNPNTKEIFFTYLSFSNRAVSAALCEAATKRNVKIKFVLDSGADQTRASELLACSPANIERKLRGSEGELGYAHNKIFIINPNTPGEFKVAFSSGNMTSGPVIHHENWNFITTNSQSQFAQAHLCAMNAEWSETAGRSRAGYIQFIRECRAKIKTPVEKDVKVFFVPGEGQYEKGINDGKKTAADYLIKGDGSFPGIQTASKIWLACHRFSYNKMINALKSRMMSSNKPDLKMIADDDTYYAVNDSTFVSDILPNEFQNMQGLVDQGGKIKYMETNSDEHQLHHSKYLIFADQTGQFTAVYTGSANLTGAGFNRNWENSYYITVPEVVKQFADHYQMMWDKMASSAEDLPVNASVSSSLEEMPQ